MRIQQVHISHQVSFFAEEFCKLWGLHLYHDVDAPALFFGCYDAREIDVINRHRGFKLVMPTGEDSNLPFLPAPDIAVLNTPFIRKPENQHRELRHEVLNIPVKDFSELKPAKFFGHKIYCYQGRGTDACKVKYNYALLQDVMEEFGADNFLIGIRGHTMEEMVNDFYTPCFLNLQLNAYAGFSSTLEMAHLGRRSICNVKAPFCIPFKTAKDVVEAIKQEQKNLYTMALQPRSVNYMAGNYLEYGDFWLNTEFWQ